MRLLIVTQKIDKNDDNLGFFHSWVEEFAKHAENLAVIAGAVGTYKFPANVEVHSLGKEKGAGKLSRLWRFWKLFSYHHARADATFFHMIPEFVVAASPFISFSRKPTGLWYVHKSVTSWLKFAERLVDYIFTASDLSFRLPSKKVIYTGHAIDTETFRPVVSNQLPVATLRLLTVGRISPVKDLETILYACEILKNSWPRSWTFSIVGGPYLGRDHEYLATLKRLVTDEGLENRVFFHGARPFSDIPAMYEDHDLFISMSATGSMDKAVLEAMSVGLSVITANEAFRELLPTPYFLEKRSPEFLASRVKMLADENRPRHILRELVVNSHSLSRNVERIVNHLRSSQTHGL
jgi:glycosyltransferase involved in cell wall biosynthesis